MNAQGEGGGMADAVVAIGQREAGCRRVSMSLGGQSDGLIRRW
jgi:hypothetical protein